MKIIRDRSEYKLTEQELRQAYQEYNLKLKTLEIKEVLKDYPIALSGIDLAVIATNFIDTYKPLNNKKEELNKRKTIYELADKRKIEIFDTLLDTRKIKHKSTINDIYKIFEKTITTRAKRNLPKFTADEALRYALREYKAERDIEY